MNDYNTVVGLDVHKKTIVAAVLPSQSETVKETISIENCPAAVEKLVNRIAAKGPVEFVYEAGPCGYETQRQITALGHKCVVIAPSLTPVRPGDRVKTDRRDAEKLARYYRAGELTEIHVPTREKEADRDLPRAREDALEDRLRARHRLSKFLLRQGRVHRETKSWGVTHRVWLKAQRFEWTTLQQSFEAHLRAVEEVEARLAILDQQMQDLAQKEPYRTSVQYLRCFKGIDTVSALTLLVEAQDFARFKRAREFMSFTGLVGSEHSSGEKIRRGGITKVGNAHIRRILVESAWSNRYRNVVRRELTNRRIGCPQEIIGIARKAQTRLHRKFWRLTSRGKLQQVAVVAVARELAGFVWSMAQYFPKEEAA